MSDHITPVLKNLHWLPISFRIDYKVLTLCYKSLHDLAPSYMTSMFSYRDPPSDRVTVHNDELHLLKEPTGRLTTGTHGDRAFSGYAPKLWNSLPLELRLSSSFELFKKDLKLAYLDRHLAILPTSDVSFLILHGTVVVMLIVILLYCIEIYVHDNVPSVLLFTGRLMCHVSGAKSILPPARF